MIELAEQAPKMSKAAEAARGLAKIEKLAKASKFGDAADSAVRLAKTQRALGTAESEKFAGRIEQLARTWREHAKVVQHVSTLPKSQKVIVKMIEDASLSVASIDAVPADVKQFVRNFGAGAREPEKHLAKIGREHADLLAHWNAVDPEYRIFLAGAGKDGSVIRLLATEFEQQGYVVFFYDFCAVPRCSSEVVGAFFGTAGHALVADSNAATASRYVAAEVTAARQLGGRDSVMILADPTKVVAAARTGEPKVSAVSLKLRSE